MAVDQVTAEVVPALRAAGITSVLLKGPAIAQWLYPEGGRYYGDVDLLAAPTDVVAAEAVLGDLGFHPPSPTRTPQPARAWRRDGHPVAVDLHHSLRHVQAPPQTVWEVLSADTVDITVAGTTVAVLGLPGRAFHIALHAAQHGVAEPKPVEDLHGRRARARRLRPSGDRPRRRRRVAGNGSGSFPPAPPCLPGGDRWRSPVVGG
jgi:hypothetical protein